MNTFFILCTIFSSHCSPLFVASYAQVNSMLSIPNPRKMKSQPGPGNTSMMIPAMMNMKPSKTTSSHLMGCGSLCRRFFILCVNLVIINSTYRSFVRYILEV